MGNFRSVLESHVRQRIELGERQIRSLEEHFNLLEKWNRVINLTRIRDLEGVVTLHYCESLVFGSMLPAANTIVDVGSGGGFPGVPVAVVHEEAQVTLVESHRRKCVFLRQVARSLPNVRVLEGRGEDLTTAFDWLVSRAVNWQEVLQLASGIAWNIGLLLSLRDAEAVRKVPGFAWNEAKPLPWGEQRVALLGQVQTRRST